MRRGRLGAASAVLMTAALVTGCGSGAEAVPPAGQMVLVAGDRQGMASIVDESGRDPEIVIASLREQLEGRFDRDMTVSVVPADGDPRTAQTESYELDTDNPTQREASPEKRLEELGENLAEVQASTWESDALSALDLGGRPTADTEDKALYVFDSGVSTAGPLALQNGLLGPETDVSEIVAQLEATGNIPHLNGVKVHWWGLGLVMAPQATPPVWARTKLEELWTAVVEAGGGSVVFHDDAVQATAPTGELPEVTPVTFSDAVAKPVAVTVHVQGPGPACPGRTPETAGAEGLDAAQAENRRVLITSTKPSPVSVQE